MRDALDEHYDLDKGCYLKAFSDKALAEKLDVPRAWVSEERDRAYGPDRNEVQSQQAGRIEALEARAGELEANALALAEQAEALKREASALRTALSYPSAA